MSESMSDRRRQNINRRVRGVLVARRLRWGERQRQECVDFLASIVGGLSDRTIYWAVHHFNQEDET
jgi:hypothetical protein